MTFSDKQKLKEFVNTPIQQKILKGFFQAEMNEH